MSKFELNIPADIKSTAWIETDPFNNEQYKPIVLSINWVEESAEVDTYISNQGIPMSEYHGLITTFSLPEDVDATSFEEYYNQNIKPIILKMSEKFESYWDGSNWKGHFVSGKIDEYGYDTYDEIEDMMKIMDICQEAWSHDIYVYSDVGESFQSYEDIIDILKDADIDFMTANLENMVIVQNIREYLEDDFLYIMSDDGFKKGLEEIRDTIINDREEV